MATVSPSMTMWGSRCGAAWLVLAIGCAGKPTALEPEPPEARWAWARSVVPELASLTPEPQAPDFAALGLDRNRVTLYAVGLELPLSATQPPACMALHFALQRGALETRVALDGKRATPELADNYSTLRLGVLLDAHEAIQDGDGLLDASSSDRLVSEATATVLRYEGRPAEYAVLCAISRDDLECGGKTVACERCEPYVAPLPLDGTGAFGTRSSQHSCAACPPDPVAPHLGALNRVVQERSWMQVQPGSGPSFYTTSSACQAATRLARSRSRPRHP